MNIYISIQTNLSCITAIDEQLVDCASTWLPDGSTAYFRCTEEKELRVRFGKIVCKGNYEMVNKEAVALKKDNNEKSLPCGIREI